jgi:hypothetical protein
VIKQHFNRLEFYVTNVCNLTCEGCNRFNNYNFAGWQRWSDYESIYEKWSQYITTDQIVLLGGEPLLNPDIIEWAYGLNRLFKKRVQILSNGTRLNQVDGLYKLLQSRLAWVGVSWHNPDTIDDFEHSVKQFLRGDVIKVGKDHPENIFDAPVMWMDRYNVKIPLWIQYEFYDSAIKTLPTGQLTLHDSDPLKAHGACGFVKHKNYHFIRGKLYKCGPVALFPEFDQQHNLGLSDQDRALLSSYKPLDVDEYETRGAEFLANIDNPLPQCKFCPESIEYKNRLFAVTKNLAKKQIVFVPI